jgi:hypothetical protein
VLVSEHAIIIVEISQTASQARQQALSVTAWLLDQEIITPNLSRDDLWHPSEYLAGPQYEEVAPDEHRQVGGANSGVDIALGRQVYHPTENYEPPTCPRCGAAIASDDHHELVEPWLDGKEPMATCATCDGEQSLGDWNGRCTYSRCCSASGHHSPKGSSANWARASGGRGA